jgi:hypothetical protein
MATTADDYSAAGMHPSTRARHQQYLCFATRRKTVLQCGLKTRKGRSMSYTVRQSSTRMSHVMPRTPIAETRLTGLLTDIAAGGTFHVIGRRSSWRLEKLVHLAGA